MRQSCEDVWGRGRGILCSINGDIICISRCQEVDCFFFCFFYLFSAYLTLAWLCILCRNISRETVLLSPIHLQLNTVE